ncbi:MAG: lysophospholipid acyltransferase family protein [Candidatus Falkowbacteria bacterium]|nr:lysophospholipid acyltransferase family protein [Candidatus Falkowbacteria bacterium]
MEALNFLFFWLFLYIAIIVLGIGFFGTLQVSGRMKIIGKKFLPKNIKNGLILVANHPSMFEPVPLGYLFIWRMIINPFKWFPYSAPDMKNFNNIWWTIFKERFVFFPRGDSKGCLAAFDELVRLLKKGRALIIHPEGGRTSTGRPEEMLYSKNGHPLRRLKPRVVRLAFQTGATIVPVYVKGTDKVLPRDKIIPRFWRKFQIRIGEGFTVDGPETKENVEKWNNILAEKILALADKD